MPEPNPTPGVAGPPSASASPSYRPPPRTVPCDGPSDGLTNSNAVRV